mgnify:CR=1 FL=1
MIYREKFRKVKNFIYKFDELAGFFFLPLIILTLILFYFKYFNILQFIWVELFIIIGWLIYIYRFYNDSGA